jgi:hypothetical protein
MGVCLLRSPAFGARSAGLLSWVESRGNQQTCFGIGRAGICAEESVDRDRLFVSDDSSAGGQLRANVLGDGENGLMG